MSTSACGLTQNLTEEEFFDGISAPRNQELMRIFRDLMLVEQLGSGMHKILEKYDKTIFNFSPNYLRVTFLYDELLSATIHEPINGSLSDTRKLVLAVLIEYQDIARKTGLSRSTVSRTLTKLQDEKRIIRIGAKKSGYWKVIRE